MLRSVASKGGAEDMIGSRSLLHGDSKDKRRRWSVGPKDVAIVLLSIMVLLLWLQSGQAPAPADTGAAVEDTPAEVALQQQRADEAADEAAQGAYPDQNDAESAGDGSGEQGPLSDEEAKLQELADQAVERAETEEAREDWEGIPVPALGGLYMQDGDKYMEAPDIVAAPEPLGDAQYKKMWDPLRAHENFFRNNTHKRYIPRLGQPITKVQFHEIFRKTSTPVILPFKFLRNLGVLTQGWTIKELRERFPFEPRGSVKNAMNRQEYNQAGLHMGKRDVDFGPAIWKIERETKIVYGASGTGNRNIPRNMMLPPGQLAKLNITTPPFLPRHHFQPLTMWMGTSSADTKMHHDCCDNFAVMIQGTKRWFIAPPTDSRKLMPNACVGKHQSLCWSPLKFPFRKNLTPREREMKERLDYIDVDVNAGEMLYLPAGWWHMVANKGPTIMVNAWVKGSSNCQIMQDIDPHRRDRPDFHNSEKAAQEVHTYIYGDEEMLN